MALHVLFPGTFDPPTRGHLDLITRASRLFERVTIGLAENPDKQAFLPIEERLALLRDCTHGLRGVTVARIEGLVVQACEELGCRVLLRGLRSGSDFDYEAAMARTNSVLSSGLSSGVETLFLASSPEVLHISSTLVRQIAGLGGDCSGLVPPNVHAALRARGARS